VRQKELHVVSRSFSLPCILETRVLHLNPMSKDTVTVMDSSFKSEVIESQVPVLVDFWATWCGPCRAIAPALEALATQYKGQVKVAKVDVDENNALAEQYGIQSIPTLLMFKGGKVVEQVVGAATKAKLEETIKKAL
jgi:thioredoxin 1